MFLLHPCFLQLVERLALRVPLPFLDLPDRQAVVPPEQPFLLQGLGIGRVRQEHDRRFEALRAVHGQNAHLVPTLVGITLDRVAVGAQPVQEALHGRRVRTLVSDGLGKKRLDRQRQRRPQSAQEPPPAAGGTFRQKA